MKVLKLVYLFLFLMGSALGNELIKAAEKGDINQVKKLLNAKVDVNSKDWTGFFSALLFASRNGDIDMVKLLLDSGASDIDSALRQASAHGHIEIVKILIDRGADVNSQNQFKDTALIWASQEGHNEIVKLLLEAGSGVNIEGSRGLTALMQASENGHKETVNILELEKTIKEIKDSKKDYISLKPYVDKLNEEDLAWFINRIVSNRNIGKLELKYIEQLVPEAYRDLVVIYRKLKSGDITQKEIRSLLTGEAEISKILKDTNKKLLYKTLRTYLEQILALIESGMPIPVASKTILEY